MVPYSAWLMPMAAATPRQMPRYAQERAPTRPSAAASPETSNITAKLSATLKSGTIQTANAGTASRMRHAGAGCMLISTAAMATVIEARTALPARIATMPSSLNSHIQPADQK